MTVREEMEQVLVMGTHDWNGGYHCACGHLLNSARGWALHLAQIIDDWQVVG